MNRLAASLFLLFAAYVFFGLGAARAAEPGLSLAAYLAQVEGKNDALLAVESASRGAGLRSGESRLAYVPNLFGTASHTVDKGQVSSFLARESQATDFYQLGISQGTGIGLTGRFYYNLYDITTKNAANPSVYDEGGTYWAAKPYIELTQSIWRNGFGSETRAQVELGQANARAQSHNEGYRASVLRIEAERAYWRLAAARLMVRSQSDSLERAQKIRSYQGRRAKLELTDRVDLLQSESSVRLRTLELKIAADEVRAASRAFNIARGVDSDSVPEQLALFASESLLSAEAPARAEIREDVKAATEQLRAASAAARIGIERQKPSVDLFFNSNLSGRDPRFAGAWEESHAMKYNTHALGVRFSMPLNPSLLADNRKGYQAEIDAADHNLRRRILDQDSDWDDLVLRLSEAKERLALAVKLEDAQREKMGHERSRQERGRTTTFQVLTFEQDFASSQTTRIRAQFDVLNVLAQMKLYAVRRGID